MLCPEQDTQCQASVKAAVRCLKDGGIVIYPTDTLYGLGADVFNEVALRRVFNIKGRPPDLALPVLVADLDQVSQVVEHFGEAARRLAERFWPGSLTLVLPKRPSVSPLVTGGRDTVAVRIPNHWVPRYLARELGRPITGTSANRSGEADLLSIRELEQRLGPQVDYIIKCGPQPLGMGSTVVDVTTDTPRLLREGVLPFAEVLQALRCQSRRF